MSNKFTRYFVKSKFIFIWTLDCQIRDYETLLIVGEITGVNIQVKNS